MSDDRKKDRPGRGYTRKDWDAVKSPELTDAQIAHGRPFGDAFPELDASIKRGRPKVEHPKEAVTLRLSPQTIERYRAKGDDWRARMAKTLERSRS